jgi:hypothetical protein
VWAKRCGRRKTDSAKIDQSASSLFWNKEEKIRPSVRKTRNAKRAREEWRKIASRTKIKEANRKQKKRE